MSQTSQTTVSPSDAVVDEELEKVKAAQVAQDELEGNTNPQQLFVAEEHDFGIPQTEAPTVPGDPPEPMKTVVINPLPTSGFDGVGEPVTELAKAFASLTPKQQKAILDTPEDPSLSGRQRFALKNLQAKVVEINADMKALRDKGFEFAISTGGEGDLEIIGTAPEEKTDGE